MGALPVSGRAEGAEFVGRSVVSPAAEVNSLPRKTGEGRWALAPHFLRQVHDHLHLGPLGVLGQHVAFLGGGKAALRREAELVERDELLSLLDAGLNVLFLLQ